MRRAGYARRFIPLLLLLGVLALPSAANGASIRLQLEGGFVQGGLVIGHTSPGTGVEYEGEPIRVSEKGVFVIGFHRDADPKATLTLTYPDGVTERRTLEIGKRDYEIQRIDGLPPSKVTPPPEVIERIKRETRMVAGARDHDTPEQHFLNGWQWPVLGRISGVYGSQRILNGQPRRPHYGIDIAAPEGTPVAAPAPGIVRLAHKDMYFSGGTVILDHGHGLTSAFLHLASVTVEPGQRLARGETIGTVGATGRATGPHLDWRMNLFERRLDPGLLMGPMPKTDGPTGKK